MFKGKLRCLRREIHGGVSNQSSPPTVRHPLKQSSANCLPSATAAVRKMSWTAAVCVWGSAQTRLGSLAARSHQLSTASLRGYVGAEKRCGTMEADHKVSTESRGQRKSHVRSRRLGDSSAYPWVCQGCYWCCMVRREDCTWGRS